MAESFFGSLECELLARSSFRNRAEARAELFRYVEGWYNTHWRHSAIGYLSPVNFEKSYAQAARFPKHPPSTKRGNSTGGTEFE